MLQVSIALSNLSLKLRLALFDGSINRTTCLVLVAIMVSHSTSFVDPPRKGRHFILSTSDFGVYEEICLPGTILFSSECLIADARNRYDYIPCPWILVLKD